MSQPVFDVTGKSFTFPIYSVKDFKSALWHLRRMCLAAEDRKAFESANPVGADGTIDDDDAMNETRESVIVRTMLKSRPVSFVVLGSAHNLADNVPDDCEYIRIETKRVSQLSKVHHE